MQLPNEDHVGWDRLLAAVLGDEVPEDTSAGGVGGGSAATSPVHVLDLRSMYAEAGAIAGDSFATPAETVWLPGREPSGSL